MKTMVEKDTMTDDEDSREMEMSRSKERSAENFESIDPLRVGDQKSDLKKRLK